MFILGLLFPLVATAGNFVWASLRWQPLHGMPDQRSAFLGSAPQRHSRMALVPEQEGIGWLKVGEERIGSATYTITSFVDNYFDRISNGIIEAPWELLRRAHPSHNARLELQNGTEVAITITELGTNRAVFIVAAANSN